METRANLSFFARHEFLLRRLHSLSGLIPVGAYMVVHLLTNASVLGGPASFQDQVDTIHRLGPILPAVEWTFIFLPIIFHTVLGVWRLRSYSPNTTSYPYAKNYRYTLQRATAWIALLFIGWHVFHMHGWIHRPAWLENVAHPLFGAQFNPEHASSSAALALAPLWVKVLYAIGVLSCVYHFANGLWTMGITWGVWTSPKAMRRADYVCMTAGLLLAIVSMSALVGMSTVDLVDAQAVERARIEQKEELEARRLHIKRELQSTADQQTPQQARTVVAGDPAQ